MRACMQVRTATQRQEYLQLYVAGATHDGEWQLMLEDEALSWNATAPLWHLI